MNKRQASLSFLRSLADALEALTDAEFDSVLTVAGLRRLPKGPLASTGKLARQSSQIEQRQIVEELMTGLSGCPSRSAARSYILRFRPTRTVLIHAAKSRDIHIAKTDTIEIIIDKLVDNVVGSRLDSEAINPTRFR